MNVSNPPPPPPLDDIDNNAVTMGKSAAQQDSNIPRMWTPTLAKPIPVVQCTAIKKDGTQCRKWAVRGVLVCMKHGAQLPQVRKVAEERVQAARVQMMGMTTDATKVLEQLMQPGVPEGIRLKAATEILDRSGLKAGMEVNVTVEHVGSPLADIMNQLDIIAGHKEPEYVVEEEIDDAEVVEN